MHNDIGKILRVLQTHDTRLDKLELKPKEPTLVEVLIELVKAIRESGISSSSDQQYVDKLSERLRESSTKIDESQKEGG